MDKHIIEAFKLHQTRRAMRRAMREARTALCIGPRVEQVRALTPQELDRFMQRRIMRDDARRFELSVAFGKKKKLPMPVFACENTCGVCGALAEDCRGMENNVFTHKPATQQVRPRVVSPIDTWVDEGGLS